MNKLLPEELRRAMEEFERKSGMLPGYVNLSPEWKRALIKAGTAREEDFRGGFIHASKINTI